MNPVLYHEAFNSDAEEVEELKLLYRQGGIGDVEGKAGALNEFLGPIRERRGYFAHQHHIEEILRQGTMSARAKAQGTLVMVKEAMGLDFLKDSTYHIGKCVFDSYNCSIFCRTVPTIQMGLKI